MLDDTKNRLQEWGEWVRSGGPSLGYSAVKLAAGSGGCTVPDDEALAVDRAVASLKHREPCMGKVLVNYYVRRWDYSMIGLDVHMSREKVRVLLRSGEAWVDGTLSASSKAG
tara:strand:+ start:136 stop:471 length:336 start_codon:yes stop_codon:yes gene_type:complete